MALDTSRVTDALPVVASCCTPESLLDYSALPATVVNHLTFLVGCQQGFTDFSYDEFSGDTFEEMVTDLYQGIHEVLLMHPAAEQAGYTFAWSVGYEVGWVSAFAVRYPDEGMVMMRSLVSLVLVLCKFGYVSATSTRLRVPGSCRRVVGTGRAVGSDGWPLDA